MNHMIQIQNSRDKKVQTVIEVRIEFAQNCAKLCKTVRITENISELARWIKNCATVTRQKRSDNGKTN